MAKNRGMASHFDNIFVTLGTGDNVTRSVKESCHDFNVMLTIQGKGDVMSRLVMGIWCGILLVVLSACQTGGHNPQTVTVDESMVNLWLYKGNTALAEDRLTSPEGENAVFYFHKVLRQVPEHPEAYTGMEKVFDRYIELAREASARGEYSKALDLLDRAEAVIIPTRVSTALRDEIVTAQQQARAKTSAGKQGSKTGAGKEPEGIEYLLSIQGLNEKDKKVRDRLKLIAEHVASVKGHVRIEGRNEAESLWIEGQLKAAMPKYKLKTVLGKSLYPKVIVLKPN